MLPFIISDITTDADLEAWLLNQTPTASAADIAAFVALYSSDPADGSPCASWSMRPRVDAYYVLIADELCTPDNTGTANQLWAQYKRQSSIFGDMSFEAPRRSQLAAWDAAGVPAWSYQFAQVLDGTSPWLGGEAFLLPQVWTSLIGVITNRSRSRIRDPMGVAARGGDDGRADRPA